jgi:hypothetical protein
VLKVERVPGRMAQGAGASRMSDLFEDTRSAGVICRVLIWVWVPVCRGQDRPRLTLESGPRCRGQSSGAELMRRGFDHVFVLAVAGNLPCGRGVPAPSSFRWRRLYVVGVARGTVGPRNFGGEWFAVPGLVARGEVARRG